MKNLLLPLLFLFPVVSFAASGACSGHGGVSCAAGPDSDGSVICNDGWTKSSVSYASMVMCRSVEPIPEPKTPTPEPVKVQTVPPVTEVVPPKPAVIPEPKKEVVVPVVVPVVTQTPKPKPAEVKKEVPVTKETKVVEPKPVVATTSEVLPVATSTKPSLVKRVFRFFWR